ncbi:hypothetical protein [Agarilytica rhodophyticola]|uniref:hypothetical protein n=1 Tax=Agarilytica rhodophyticola TaxID=1737490 RepID=UPI000B3470D5|nr:hypothetical protein [Agarilytica rhodophyticola]
MIFYFSLFVIFVAFFFIRYFSSRIRENMLSLKLSSGIWGNIKVEEIDENNTGFDLFLSSNKKFFISNKIIELGRIFHLVSKLSSDYAYFSLIEDIGTGGNEVSFLFKESFNISDSLVVSSLPDRFSKSQMLSDLPNGYGAYVGCVSDPRLTYNLYSFIDNIRPRYFEIQKGDSLVVFSLSETEKDNTEYILGLYKTTHEFIHKLTR